MKLFRDGNRTEMGRIKPKQTSFDWLDNSAKAGSAQARDDLQALFERLPVTHRVTIANRIRKKGADHDAAISEVYAHELFLQSGYAVTPEPTTPTGSHPDFLIELDAYRAYVEVTTELGPSKTQKEQTALDEFIMATSSRVASTGFGFLIRRWTKGTGNPSPKYFAKFLDAWFQTFDYAKLRSAISSDSRSFDELPSTKYIEKDSGWKLTLTLYPAEDSTKRPDSLAMASTGGAGWTNSVGRLRDNIRDKVKQHRDAEFPLIVCVMLNDFVTRPDREHILNALIGSESWIIDPDIDEAKHAGRKTDGIWSRRSGKGSERPAAVVLVDGAFPWTFRSVEPELWDNPNIGIDDLPPAWLFKRFRWDVKGSGALNELTPKAKTVFG